MKGRFANRVLRAFAPDVVSYKALGMLVKSAHKNLKKAKEDKFCADKFNMFIKLCKNEGNLDVRNMLSDSRKKIIDQNKTRLRHVIKFVEFCDRQERISKKQDDRLVGRIPVFVVSTIIFFTNYVLSLTILITSNFSFSRPLLPQLQPPLRKILAAPLHAHVVHMAKH